MKYFIYARKSTDSEERQVLSIEAQLAELKEFAAKEKLEIVASLCEAKTAKEPGRTVFGEMLDRIEKGAAQGILAWHPDRLARNSIDGGRIIYLLDTGKLKDLKFPTFWFDNTPQGKFMLNIAFGQSKYYIDNLSENIKRGHRAKLRKGIWPSFAPLGYLNNNKTKGIAAIASSHAAKIYGLEVLAKDIETNTHNFTRFLVIGKRNKEEADRLLSEARLNKSSLMFSLPHEEGSLSKVLTILTFYNINLTKIQSLPIIGREWEYLFYIDVIFKNYQRYHQSLDAIRPLTGNLLELGEYEAADTVYVTNGGTPIAKVQSEI